VHIRLDPHEVVFAAVGGPRIIHERIEVARVVIVDEHQLFIRQLQFAARGNALLLAHIRLDSEQPASTVVPVAFGENLPHGLRGQLLIGPSAPLRIEPLDDGQVLIPEVQFIAPLGLENPLHLFRFFRSHC